MVQVPLMLLSDWREFPSKPCLARKKNLMTARVSMLLKSRASPDTFPFSLCNKKRLAIRHMNRPPFPKTLSIPSYDTGKYVGLRTYQHTLVQQGVIENAVIKIIRGVQKLAAVFLYWSLKSRNSTQRDTSQIEIIWAKNFPTTLAQIPFTQNFIGTC